MVWSSLKLVTLSLIALRGLTSAHPGEADKVIHSSDVGRYQLEATKRHIQARNCAPQIAAHVAARKTKRALASKPNMRRWGPDSVPQGAQLWRRDHGYGHGHHSVSSSVIAGTGVLVTSTSSAEVPTYTNIQNSTCVTAPETTEGPYFVNNELVRSDVRENQSGVDLLLDIGVIDTTTCQPLDQAFVEIWSCNATGTYGGFTTAVMGPIPSQVPPSSTTTPRAPPIPNMTDQLTFLRGGFPTNKNGILEFKTIYPGYYNSRSAHIHAIVQTNYTIFPNGTVASRLGDIHHIGQVFFDEALNDKVYAEPTYSQNTQNRTLNSQDPFIQSANLDGYNAFVDADLLGETVADGILGYITIGIDTTRRVNITSNNYASTILWGSGSPIATVTDAANMF